MKPIKLSVLGRADLFKSKLFALDNCVALAPTRQELDEALGHV
jgi:hypothetical protein